MRSLTDYLLFLIGLVPLNDNYSKIKEKLDLIPSSKIFSVLYYFRSEDISNPIKLIKELGLDKKTEKLIITNVSGDKKLFKHECLSELALRRLEWKLIRVVHIYQRDDMISSIDNNMIDYILDENHDLIDIINVLSDKTIYSIGRSLTYKLRDNREIYDLCRKLLDLDTKYTTLILADSLEKDGHYDMDKLKDRIDTRIKSSKDLTKII